MTAYPSPNYTKVPNDLFDLDLRDMGLAELKCTLAIIRKTLGFHKDGPEPISYSQLEKLTGLSRQGVINGTKSAVDRGRVKRLDIKGPRGINLYGVNIVDQSTQLTSEGATSQLSRLDLVNPVDTQKKLVKESAETAQRPTTKEKNLAAQSAAESGSDSETQESPTDPTPDTDTLPPVTHADLFGAICDTFKYVPNAMTPEEKKVVGGVARSLKVAGCRPEQIAPFWAWVKALAQKEAWKSAPSIHILKTKWSDYAKTVRVPEPIHVPIPQWRIDAGLGG